MEIKKYQLNDFATLTAYIPDSEVGYHFYKNRPGIILAPGGAYLIHATREQEGVAIEFMAQGYNVFLLNYSIGFSSREAKEENHGKLDTDHRYPKPVFEMMEAVHFIKANKESFHLDEKRLFLMGFSAGGHLCASYGIYWNHPEWLNQLSFVPKSDELRITGVVLGYPMINPSPQRMKSINDPSNNDTKLLHEFLYQNEVPTQEQEDELNLSRHVNRQMPPVFLWHSMDDPIVDAADSTRFVLALQENEIPCEYHLFSHGGHGLCLANKIYARTQEEVQPDIAQWTALARQWMERICLIPPHL